MKPERIETKDTPLLELLDNVPMNGRAIYETIQGSTNIPYGNLCYLAAMKIRELEKDRERFRTLVTSAAKVGELRAKDANYVLDLLDAAMEETK